jgi:hypothetical protein
VLGGPVFSYKLMDLVVEKLRAKLVVSGCRNAGNSIVRCIDRWVFSLVLLEGEGGFFELNQKGLKENVWNILCVVEEGKGNVFKDNGRDFIRVEREVGGMSEPGCESALGLV